MLNPDEARTTLKHAFQLIKAGEKKQARKIVGEFLKANPRSADGWYLAALVTDEPEKKLKIVERVLEINPQHIEGNKLLKELTTSDEMINDLLQETNDLEPEPKSKIAPVNVLTERTSDFLKGRGFWIAIGVLVALLILSILILGQSRGELFGIVFRASITPSPTNTSLPTFTPTTTHTSTPTSTQTFTPSPTLDFTSTAMAEYLKIETAVVMTMVAQGNSTQNGQQNSQQNLAPTVALHLDPLVMPTATLENRMVKEIVPIDYTVRDAAYDSTLQKIIVISDSNQLHIYDPESNNDKTIDLSRETLSLSVSPDGMFAAVGHDALVSYVDLKNAKLITTLDVPVRINHLVLAGNGWIYIEDNTSSESMVGVQITTGRQVQGSVLEGETFLRLSPNGQKIYGANRGISPDDIFRVDIGPEGFANPTPGYAANSPYHGDYEICGDLWLSQDGQRIFTACGAIFRTSDNLQQDMTYNGSITNDLSQLSYVAHSQAAGIVVGLSASDSRGNVMGVWEYENLSLIKLMALPDYHDQLSTGHFVFFNPTSTRYYVILSTYTRPGAPRSFGIVTGDYVELSGGAQLSALQPTQLPKPNLLPDTINSLNFNILDAEYSASIDRIIAVSESPDQLHIYDPVNKLDSIVSLDAPPLNLSLSPDGLSAAIGHLNPQMISIVDLKTAKVTKTLNLSIYIDDILLADNGWVYISVRGIDDWPMLYAVNISTDQVVSGPRTNGGSTTLRLYANGKKIYGASLGISPVDIMRVDIGSNGFTDPIPSRMIESPYHGQYNMCGNLWFLQDAQRILTACGDIFLASDNPDQDMTHIGTMGGTQFTKNAPPDVPAIRQLTQAGKLVLGIPLPEPPNVNMGITMPENQIVVWNAGDLKFRKFVHLDDFSAKGSTKGRFIFVNAAGTQYYVIVQAGEEAGLLYDFAIITGKISDL